MDDMILTGLLEDTEEILPQLKSINQRLASKEDQLELYEEFGQVVDRLFGVLGMMNLPELTDFFGAMKETCYKCSRSDNERAYPKVMELMKSLVEHLEAFKICHADPQELKALNRKVGLDNKRAAKIIAGALYSIREASVKSSGVELNALIFDKLDKMTSIVNSSKDIIYPTPVFYNAAAGFIKKIQDQDYNVGVIIIDATVSKNVFLPLVDECNEHRVGIPIVLLTKDPETFGGIDKEKMGISSVEKFPMNFKSLKSIVQKATMKDENSPTENQDQAGKIEKDGGDFIEVKALNIHVCQSNPFDIYVKINDNKFVLISNENSNLTKEQVDGHNSKGVNSYFVKKEHFQKYLDQSKEEINRVLEDPKADFGVRVSKTLSLGAEVYSYMEKSGVDKNNINEAHNFVEKTINLLDKVDHTQKGGNLLKAFMADVANQEHAVSVAMFSGIFLDAIGASFKIKKDIVMSAFLHDIGLYGTSDVIKSENEESMSDEEKEIYYQHPLRGAQMLKEMELKGVLLEAIEQHHIRVGNKGFPKWEQGSVNKLNNIAEVIGISEELSWIVSRGDEKQKENPFLCIDIKDYSPIIQRAYKDLFNF